MPYATCRTDVNAMSAIMRGRLPFEVQGPSSTNSVPTPFQQYMGLWPLCLRCWDTDAMKRIIVPEIVEHESLRYVIFPAASDQHLDHYPSDYLPDPPLCLSCLLRESLPQILQQSLILLFLPSKHFRIQTSASEYRAMS